MAASRLRRGLIGALAGGALLLLLGFLIVRVATYAAPPVAAAPIQARLELAAGEVTVGIAKESARALSGTPLLAGARVGTAKGARALVRLPDGASLFLRDLTDVGLDRTSVALDRGEYWLDAPPTEREPMVHRAGGVSVSAADAGLSVRRDGEAVNVYVARGMAVVQGPGGRVEVNAGEQATVSGRDAPKVTAVAFWEDWTGGMADFDSGGEVPGAGSGTIYGVDVKASAGSPAQPLEISKQAVRATLREGLSETEVDQTFYNPGQRAVEGWYWFTVPRRASVTSFAVETEGKLVEGEFQELREAKETYDAAKITGHSPAILEWVDDQTYRARIYPIAAGGSRRVLLRYVELRPLFGGRLSYVYPMGARDPTRIGEFSLSVDLGPGGEKMQIATLADARVENKGRKVTMRRSGYTPRADFQLEAVVKDAAPPPLTVARFAGQGESADYVMARYMPDLDWKSVGPQQGEIVVVVDTSAAGDESTHQLKTATAEAILRALSDEDRFALIALDAKPTVLHPKAGLAPASDQEIADALEHLADHSTGGATDLSAIFDVALQRLHGAEQPALVYVGDGLATSGELTGQQLGERLRRALASSRARLFTVGVGLDADHSLLGELARAGGGEAFHVEQTEETTAQALKLAASLKVPTITDLRIDLGAGLDDVFATASGKVSRGTEVIVLARTHHEIPRQVTVKGRVGARDFERTYQTASSKPLLNAFVPRLWAAEHVRRLLGSSEGPDAERGRVTSLGLEYGLMTPYTSIIALESEEAYRNLGIERRPSKLRGVRLGALDPASEARMESRTPAPFAATGIAFGCKGSDSAPAMDTEQTKASEADEPSGSTLAGKEEESVFALPAPAPPPAAPMFSAATSPTPVAIPEPQLAPNRENEVAAARPKGRPIAESDARGQHHGPTGNAPDRGGFDRKGSDDGRVDSAPMGAIAPPPPVPRAKEMATTRAAGRLAANREAAAAPPTESPPVVVEVLLGTCSDAARRPLPQRLLLWKKRLKTARNAPDLLARYDAARTACELPDWHAERSFLELMQRSIDTEGDARVALGRFAARPEVKKYLAQLILRRAVDERLVAVVEAELFGRAVNWAELDRKLTEFEKIEDRIAKVREAMAKAPDDPNGGMRLVELLVEAGMKDEALALGRRLRDQGTMTPSLAQQLGNVLARAGLPEEAVRTYSEIVEFDPRNLASRRLLGDIYLGHGWYAPAYLQYSTLTEMDPDDPLAWLRLAGAAAGTGRIDEALRLERKVASAQGNPGPTDPRRWARMMSAARLARLIAKPPAAAPGQDPARRLASVQRELKELGLFSGPGTLVLLTWEDLATDLFLSAEVAGQAQALGEVIDAAPVGLSAVLASTPDANRATFTASVRNVPLDRTVKLLRQDIRWDGKAFQVVVKEHRLESRAASVAL
ncbi:MAG: VWA domain-containing protein [Polyangiaceae bacterium]|nr:VWA domain-containing protein [Polyangiaceae bacterium]